MMKILLMLMFLIPLSFFDKKFWLNMYLFMMMSFIFMLKMKFSFQLEEISYGFMFDLLSYTMILLSFWICSLMILASSKIFLKNNYYKMFLMVMVMMLISLYMAFSSSNMFIFYLFFEMSLIPTLMLIIGWGYQPERMQAGNYLMFYTLFASLPMMIFMFFYYELNNSLVFYLFKNYLESFLMLMLMNMVFMVKMPMFFVHLWLPKAHVEAPVAGSMILAGVMLKLGGYGLMRTLKIFLYFNNSFNYLFISISLLGGFFISMICVRQSDIKSLIAYSSVAHMGLVLSGLMTMNSWGFYGGLIMMLAHGLCSSGLFCLANISYERLMSRSFYLSKGMINLMPSLSLWWFLFCSSNMAAPPSFNLLGEIFLINSVISWSSFSIIFLSLLSFFSAVYSLFLYSYTQHGVYYSGLFSFYSSNFREYLLLVMHWFPLNILIFKSELFFSWI
uniref:NADH-ubiquinone oxidoreductase chain 4 n=1 Tax=Staphylinidae sp. BMNH 1274252 TaxID=1796573 RepID=A0A126TDT2_9COLE|nr:NADH dehydrogenase subunit 4 [Staphylinidae sp. BMNH 1274252]